MAEQGEKRGKAAQQEAESAPDPAEKVAAAIRSITGSAPKASSVARSDAGNTMLDALVYGDNDLIGLVAYAMHELNRRDWCVAYEAANGRPPSDGELKAYLVGEQLERRLDTYRRLSEDALAKLANSDQPMRRLIEPAAPAPAPPPPQPVAFKAPAPVAAPAPAPVAAVAPPPPPPPQPAPVPHRQPPPPAYEPPMPDESYAPPPRRKNWAGLIFYLVLLLGAVVALGYIIRSGLIIPGVTK